VSLLTAGASSRTSGIPSENFEGLSDIVAAERLKAEGPNELPSAKPKGFLRIAAEVLREPMFLLLIATGAVYLVLGSVKEAIALAVSILVVVGITLYQETKTERTLQALRDLSSPRALVVRDGSRKRISGREVVRGDLAILSEGDRVAADAFVLSAVNLAAEESLLTGESVPVRKAVWDRSDPIPRPGGDDVPAVFSGTLIVKGSGTAIVTSTGPRTEMGKLGLVLKSIELENTSLERETKSLVRIFAAISVVLCAAVAFVFGLTRGSWMNGFLAGLALAISLVPEEFPVVLAIFLALGAWRISRKRVLTRRVPAIEMLGETTVLCVDKTGTLTMNQMAVREVIGTAPHTRAEVVTAAMLASADNPVDPMEKALHEAAAQNPGRPLNAPATLIREYPLSGQLLAMSRVLEVSHSEYEVFAKGAPEAIAQLCRVPSEEIASAAQKMADRGLRILGVAHARAAKKELPDSQLAFRFEFLGLVGLEDPVRPSAVHAIRECYSAGIRVVMITGDFPATARNIARQIGLKNPDETIKGTDLAAMSPGDLQERIREVNVFARVMPEQKLQLVEALKANGEIVAMSGDGVNDAPALKAAHIGIAMGGRGTDVAREAASLVLLDDDFSSIVEAIRLGRRIYDNLKKAMTYIFAIHVPIAGMSLLPVLFRLPLVMMPLHIVFLELVIDPACSTAFESEPEHSNIMNRPPRDPAGRMFDKKTVAFGLLQGFVLFLVTLSAFLVSLHRGNGEQDARTISFTTLVLGNLALIWSNRSRTQTIPELLRSRNVALWVITAGAAAFLAIVLYVPWARSLFQFSVLHVNDVLVCILLAMMSVTWFEAAKVVRRRWLTDTAGNPSGRLP
jgi:Ca2+-transporting ATPase